MPAACPQVQRLGAEALLDLDHDQAVQALLPMFRLPNPKRADLIPVHARLRAAAVANSASRSSAAVSVGAVETGLRSLATTRAASSPFSSFAAVGAASAALIVGIFLGLAIRSAK